MRPKDIELSRRYTDILRASGTGLAQFLGARARERGRRRHRGRPDRAASGRSDSCVRVATYALRGFLEHVLERADAKLAKLPCPRLPKRLPEVLSPEEVGAIIDAELRLGSV